MTPLKALDLSWHEGHLAVFLPIILATVFFIVFWFTSKSGKVKDWFYRRADADEASVNHITFNRVVGFAAMGVMPALVLMLALPGTTLASLGLKHSADTALFSLIWTLILSALVIPLALVSARKPKNLVNYPQIRARVWTNRIVLINALGWALYLFGYEFLFRGVLLFPLVEQMGVWPAIAVNIALYSATHIPKGLEETIGAIPLGLVLCLLTLASGTIWIAFLVHLAMAWTNSFTALKFHPDIHYQKSRI
ncbi:MAG: CPBP family glutamic-type intramembrane protease [Bacteroides sp.]|jgi:membrane protease YdiL (CAAX protease family)|nr:CPBP family glutamic-type intramembrane protease [Bacteroides sp.]